MRLEKYSKGHELMVTTFYAVEHGRIGRIMSRKLEN